MKTVWRVFGYLKRYPWLAAGTLACAITGTLMVIVFPAVTKRIIESQGGRVGVRSTPEVGSVFFAILPCVARPLTKASPEPTSAATAAAPGSPTILVIEDDPKDRAWISRTLSEAGWGVQTASTGAEALAQLDARVFDAITLDLLLPDMPGRRVLEVIRHDGLNCETPVIIVTVAPDLGVAAGFHVHDILAKPVSEQRLLTSLLRARAHPDGGRPILIVDDDATSLKIAEKMLKDVGYRAVCRGDAESGLEAAAAEPPCAVVLRGVR